MMKWLDRLEEVIVVIVLVTMSVIAFLNVLSRNFMGISLAFTEEITINLFVLLTFVGASIGVRKNAHLGFTLLFERSPFKLQQTLIVFVGVIAVIFFGAVFYYGMQMIAFQVSINSTTPALGWPKWIFSIGLPIGALLCAFRSIQASIKEWKDLSGNKGGVTE